MRLFIHMKQCNKCREQKQLEAFGKNKRAPDGLERRCRSCERTRCESVYAKRRDKALAKCKEYREANKEYYKQKTGKWREANPEYFKQWSVDNPGYNAKWYKHYESSLMFRARHSIRTRLWHMVKTKNWNKPATTYELVGCSWEDLMQHLKSQLEPWMTELNYGKCIPGEPNVGWDIDHIIPLASAQSEDDLIKLCHYTNLRPLCSNYNRYVKRHQIEA